MKKITTTFFLLFALFSVAVVDMAQNLGAEARIEAWQEKATKRCLIGMGRCGRDGDQRCRDDCKLVHPFVNAEGYCDQAPNTGRECFCAYDADSEGSCS